LGDGLTPTLTVLLICDNGTVLCRHRVFILAPLDPRGSLEPGDEVSRWAKCGIGVLGAGNSAPPQQLGGLGERCKVP